MKMRIVPAIAVLLLVQGSARADSVCVVREPAAANAETPYISNRAPLVPSRLMKLPIGAITPKGWLRRQLELERDGMTGRLPEVSPWCRFEGNAWTNPKGHGHSGWEEMPYWLKGYGDLGYVLRDERILKDSRRWVDAILANQEPDGWFGPRELKRSLDGKADLWPNMLALNVLQSFYEYTQDERVLPFMTHYFKWELAYPEADFLAGFWPNMRADDNLESVYWLYNRTGEKWLLDLAAKIHRRGAKWADGIANWHGVNLAQGFREPGVYYLQAGDKKFLDATERNYQALMGVYGQFPGGGYAADENCRPGYTDPRQGCETCSWVEFMHSFEMLVKFSANPLWADRCEEVAFNSLPAAMTPDEKALHYLTGANMVRMDRHNKAPGIQNGGTMLSFSPTGVYRCCQHNVSHGWPYYAEELWLATGDRGLCASLYAASDVSAKVGDGTTVTVAETTDYPFDGTIQLKLSSPKTVRFPLYLRVPRWCGKPSLRINGTETPVVAEGLSYIRIERDWNDGDAVALQLPMAVRVKTWAKNKNAVSVEYGPLAFSLKIGEEWSRYGGSDAWPELELLPTTPWNYGLVPDAGAPAGSLELVRSPGPLAAQPFTPETVPLAIKAKAKKIPGWTLDSRGLLNTLRASPVRSAEPVETVTLIPIGAARLRITAFPTIGDSEDAQEWSAPLPPDVGVSASHCFDSDTIDALDDGIIPTKSSDVGIPRFTWWDHRGTSEWVQYDFRKAKKIASVEVYWFDDTGMGFCRTPKSWRLLYKDGKTWKPVPGASHGGVTLDQFNRLSFPPVTTTGLRIEVQLQPNFSGGILEWRYAGP